ncbi:MAG: hypothetical protein KGL39_22410 [Patescibacteria group bacterium]|nr:hypothetical protein [Patescibacteria group bacterium]
MSQLIDSMELLRLQKAALLVLAVHEYGMHYYGGEVLSNNGGAVKVRCFKPSGTTKTYKLVPGRGEVLNAKNKEKIEVRLPSERETVSILKHKGQHSNEPEEHEEEEQEELTARQIMLMLFNGLTAEPLSSKKLMAAIGLDEEYKEVVLTILRKLADAGKIKKVKMEEGGVRWSK